MGIKDKLRELFDGKSTNAPQEAPDAEVEIANEQAQFLALADEIKSQVINDLVNEDVDTEISIEPVLVSEYDVGEVEVGQLTVDEAVMSNYSEINVVNHESLDDIVEHLKDAELIGDGPEEVTFKRHL